MREGPHFDSLSVICTWAYTFCHRDKLARWKEDGIHHPNLNLFLINGYSACSALWINMFYKSCNCLMKSIISHKCLGIRNVNLFNVGIKMSFGFFINITGSVNTERGLSLSWPLRGPAESSLHWLSWVMGSFLVQSPVSGAITWKFCPLGTGNQSGVFSLESAVGVAGLWWDWRRGRQSLD